jgi:GxxExxY protein
MPITCPLELRCLTEEEFNAVDYRVMGHAFASQNELGRLCEEEIYQHDLQARLLPDGFRDVQIEVPVTVSHAGFSKVYSVDIVVEHAVYELKAAAALSAEHQAQLLNYLFLLGVPRGKLVNFRPPKVDGCVHATRISPEARRRVSVDATRWRDVTRECATLRQTMGELLADWGAFLEVALYQDALTHLLGGESCVVQRLPLHRDGLSLGAQRFLVHSAGTAFRVTAVTEGAEGIEAHLRRLLALTDLQAIQWINLDHADIHFVSLTR